MFLAVMDTLEIEAASVAGWSDGAVIGLMLAEMAPQRVAGVFCFACNFEDA